LSGARWTAAAARRDLAVLFACVLAGAWLAPLLPRAAAGAAVAAASVAGVAWTLRSLRRQGVSLRELGIRGDDLHRSGPVFLGCALATAAAFAWAGALDPAAPGRLADPSALAGYALWALFQQFLVVSMLWRHAGRWLSSGTPERVVSAANLRLGGVTALAFALIHAPNLRLMALVFAAEWVWLLLFARFRNLFALAAAHAISALVVAEALQPHWLPTARVGLSYLLR
jgi:hypothetical protein